MMLISIQTSYRLVKMQMQVEEQHHHAYVWICGDAWHEDVTPILPHPNCHIQLVTLNMYVSEDPTSNTIPKRGCALLITTARPVPADKQLNIGILRHKHRKMRESVVAT
jgi:hypothetical protein